MGACNLFFLPDPRLQADTGGPAIPGTLTVVVHGARGLVPHVDLREGLLNLGKSPDDFYAKVWLDDQV